VEHAVSDSIANNQTLVPAPQLITSAKALPDWAQFQLNALGVDFDLVVSNLLDPEGHWLILETTQSLATTDTNDFSDIYRLDLQSHQLALISAGEAGWAGNGPSGYPAADAFGELIVFHSEADNLVTLDTNEVSDVFLHNFALAITERLTDADAPSAHPGIDAGGKDIVYDQRGPEGRRAIRADGDNIGILSLGAAPSGIELDNHHPAISADGRLVAYLEEQVSTKTSDCQVHIYDRETDLYHRQPCPEVLANSSSRARPMFSQGSDEIHWHLPNQAHPVIIPNPLVKNGDVPF
jgi:Tol biopolymer transport system component